MASNSQTELDDTDWRILGELQRDARLSFSALGRLVALSPPAVAERVRRLEEAGVIRGYAAQVDPERVGLPVLAFVRVVTTTESEAGFRAMIAALPGVLECHRVTGADHMILKVMVTSIRQLEALLDRLMPYGGVTTSIVLSTPLAGRAVTRQALTDPPG